MAFGHVLPAREAANIIINASSANEQGMIFSSGSKQIIFIMHCFYVYYNMFSFFSAGTFEFKLFAPTLPGNFFPDHGVITNIYYKFARHY